ncbi:hypothetical protein Pfo_002342 [Paulownia fortunei]|nr:hypothetical protein Pfo_002342 [Paulownia fortunei]
MNFLISEDERHDIQLISSQLHCNVWNKTANHSVRLKKGYNVLSFGSNGHNSKMQNYILDKMVRIMLTRTVSNNTIRIVFGIDLAAWVSVLDLVASCEKSIRLFYICSLLVFGDCMMRWLCTMQLWCKFLRVLAQYKFLFDKHRDIYSGLLILLEHFMNPRRMIKEKEKLTPARKKSKRTQMESSLTKLEIDAVLQLIQLSGSSADDFRVFWVNFPAEKDEENKQEEEYEEGSVGKALSSTLIDPEKCLDEVLPRRKTKFGSLVDIYRKTESLIENRAKKRARF